MLNSIRHSKPKQQMTLSPLTTHGQEMRWACLFHCLEHHTRFCFSYYVVHDAVTIENFRLKQ